MAQPPRIADGVARWLQTLESSQASLSAAHARVSEAELALTQNVARLAALRTLSQRLAIGQETVDAALELLWQEESRLSDELEELEARLSRRQIETAEHADAERSQARAGALQTIEALAEVQRSLSQLAASVQPPPLPAAPPAETLATTLTHTEEELREALSQLTAVVNTHLNALLWTQQEAEEAERTIQALAGSRSVLR